MLHRGTPEEPFDYTDSALSTEIDGVLFDLDGVVYLGPEPVPNAVEAINALTARGVSAGYVTNNAGRAPEAVAEHLSDLGIETTADQVTTAAQAVADLLASTYEPGTTVLVVGADGLRQAVTDRGLTVVASSDDRPQVVVQGMSRTLTWSDLAEGVYAINAGADFYASNIDSTMPTERGMAPGNGAFVAATTHATGVVPITSGKPQPEIFHQAVARAQMTNAVMVGDRLNTDIEGARAADIASLFVLTGVDGPGDLIGAIPSQRPSLLAHDLRGLHQVHPRVTQDDDGWVCRDAHAGWVGDALITDEGGERNVVAYYALGNATPPDFGDAAGISLDALRAACAAAWSHAGEVIGASNIRITTATD